MATMLIAGEKLQMPVWLKARLLQVTETDNANILSVESGSERNKSYPVEHDGQKSTHCPCKAIIEDCAHRIAADRYLENERAQRQLELDAAAVVAPLVLGDLAEDLTAHIDDELAAQAEAIIADELVRAEVAAIEDIDSDAMEELACYRTCSLTAQRKVEMTPFGTMVLMR